MHSKSGAPSTPSPAGAGVAPFAFLAKRALWVQAAAWATVALLVGLGVTYALLSWQSQAIDARARAKFDLGVDQIETAVHQSMGQALYLLRGTRASYALHGSLQAKEFAAYVQGHNLPSEFPGLRGLGVIERVLRHDVPALVDRQRALDNPDFAVRSTGDAPDLYVITRIEPLEANRAALGFDLGSEAVRREAIERAVEFGEPALSGRITLMQASGKNAGFLYYLPVYRHGLPLDNPQQRQEALLEVLYTPIVAAEVLEGVTRAADGLLDFELFDGDGSRAEDMVFDADHHLDSAQGTLTAQDFAGRHFDIRKAISIGGRTLTMRISSTPAFDDTIDRSSLQLIAVGGAVGSMLMALSAWLLSMGQVRAQRLARRMTAELAQMAQVVQSTSNAVTIMDADMRITWINEGFTRITGYTLAEAGGRTPGELLGSGKTDAAAIATLIAAAQARETCRVEVINRAKDGSDYWVDTEVQPTYGPDGEFTGFMEIGADITGVKKAQARVEAALRETDALLATIHMHAIVSVADRNGNIIDLNDAFCAISGYSREELMGHNHRLVKSGEQDPQFWHEVWATIAAGKIWKGEVCNRAKDGRLYWVDSVIAPFMGDDGLVEKYISIRTDITGIKTAQQQMAALTDRLTLAIEGGSDGLWDWLDVHASAQWWSPNYYKLIGYTPEELPASVESFNSILHPDHIAVCQEASALAFAGTREYDEEHLLRTKNQGYRWFRSRAKVYRNAAGEPVRMAGSSQDVHDRKSAEQALRASQSFLDRVGRIARVGGWVTDLVTDEMQWSSQARQILEVSDDTSITRADLPKFFGPQEMRVIVEGRAAAVASGEPFFLEIPIVTANGRERWLYMSGDVEYDAKGKAIRLVGAVQDITSRKQDELLLKEALQHAQEASVSKSQFLANMSHEIRTPMNAILGLLQLLQNTSLNAVQSDYAVKTEGAARSLLGLLNDILDFSKVEAGKMTLDPRPFRVDRLMRDLSVILLSNAGAKAIDVRFEVDPDLPEALVADDMRLQQVLINLGGNAIKFTSAGEVVVRLRLLHKSDTQATVEFSVRDSGIGIAPENQAHIFSGFSQAEASTTRRFGGTGLGLAISSRLVVLLGGQLQLNSVVGQGSTFYFQLQLPVAHVAAPAVVSAPAQQDGPDAPAAPAKAQRLQGLRILLVEDNKINQMVAKGLLSQEGAEITVAEDGQQGVNVLTIAPQDFDVVLMDVQMPVMDGYTATRCIRNDLGLTRLPIIAMTANAMASDRTACLEAGMNDHVGKPFELDKLVATLLHYAARDGSAADNPIQPAASAMAQGVPAGDMDVEGAIARMGGNSTMYATVAHTFANDMLDAPAQLERMLAAEDYLQATRLLHTVKGIAATVGARHLTQELAQLESRLKGGVTPAEHATVLNILRTAITSTHSALQPVLRQYPVAGAAAASSPSASAQWHGTLHTLLAQLQADDMAAMESHALLRQQASATTGPLWDALDRAMSAMDFDQAAQHCAALLQEGSR